MKSNNFFAKTFLAVSLLTIGFLGLAGYATTQAFSNDPLIVKKLEDKYNMQINANGIYFSSDSTGEATQNSWKFKTQAQKITLKLFAADISFERTTSAELVVDAKGDLDKNKVSQLLKIDETQNEIGFRQPENGTHHLQVRVQIPDSFKGDIEIVTVNGDISLKQLTLNELIIKSVSGEMKLDKLTAKSLDIKTISGDIKLDEASVSEINGKSVSGSIEITNKIPAAVSFASISGDVKLKMPKSEDYKFSLRSVSGDIKNNHHDNSSGKSEVSITTTSGDIDLE